MPSLVVLGATGFLGKHLIATKNVGLPIKAVARIPHQDGKSTKEIIWYRADLMVPGALDTIINAGDIVVNLIYIYEGSSGKNILLLKNIIDSCNNLNVARLIHCSTALVIGATGGTLVDESTPCLPSSRYEKIKYDLELLLLERTLKTIDVGILRPTAILGAGGMNLVKLANQIQYSSTVFNYFRASLYGFRPMHLVPVKNVVGALLHLALSPSPLRGESYIVAADDDQDNSFRRVEAILMDAMNLRPRKIPLIPIPKIFLSIFLRILGRQDFGISRHYISKKLYSTGFVPSDNVLGSIHDFWKGFRN